MALIIDARRAAARRKEEVFILTLTRQSSREILQDGALNAED